MTETATNGAVDVKEVIDSITSLKADLQKFVESAADKSQVEELQKRIDALSQAIEELKSEGQTQAADLLQAEIQKHIEKFKELAEGQGKFRFKVTTTAAFTGEVIPAYRLGQVFGELDSRFHIRNILPVVPVQGNSVRWVRGTTTAGGADIKQEASAVLETQYAFNAVTVELLTVQAWSKLSREALTNADMLRQFIRRDLLIKVLKKEDEILITNPNGSGLVDTGTAWTSFNWLGISVANPNEFDVITWAARRIAEKDFEADAVLVSHVDYQKLLTLKDANGQYLYPQAWTNPQLLRIGNITVYPTSALAPDNFIVLDSKRAALIGVGNDLVFETTTLDQDDFIKHIATMQAWEYVAPLVTYPEAIVYGTFTQGITDLT